MKTIEKHLCCIFGHKIHVRSGTITERQECMRCGKVWIFETRPVSGVGTSEAARIFSTPNAYSASPENERYLWMQLEDARRERESARSALRDIREKIMNEKENGLWESGIILSIVDRALSPQNSSLPNVPAVAPATLDSASPDDVMAG